MNKNKADQSKYSPSVYHNKECGLITLVHGDDFITVGNRKNTRWFEKQARGADSRSRQRSSDKVRGRIEKHEYSTGSSA